MHNERTWQKEETYFKKIACFSSEASDKWNLLYGEMFLLWEHRNITPLFKNPHWALCQMWLKVARWSKSWGQSFFFCTMGGSEKLASLNTATAPPLTRSEQVTLRLFVSPPSLSGNQQTVSDPFNFFVCFCSRPLPSFPLSPAMPENRPMPQFGINQLPSWGRGTLCLHVSRFLLHSSSSPS